MSALSQERANLPNRPVRYAGCTLLSMSELNAVWSAVIDHLAGELSAQDLGPLRRTRLTALVEDTALVDAPDAATRDMIEARLKPTLTATLRHRLGRDIPIVVRLNSAP